jgi:hypothetical protein
MASFSASDLTYIIAEYRTMAELCAGRAMGAARVEALVAAGRLPAVSRRHVRAAQQRAPAVFDM